MHGRQILIATMSIALLAGAPGCVQSRGFHDPRAEAVESDCVFDAANLRIHPLSRFALRGEGEGRALVLDAHLELVDNWGDTAKTLGIVRLELRRSGMREGDLRDSVRWEVDLRDPSINSARFDRVTQTYLLRLRDLPEWVQRDPWATLSATFARDDGVSFMSSLRIDTWAE